MPMNRRAKLVEQVNQLASKIAAQGRKERSYIVKVKVFSAWISAHALPGHTWDKEAKENYATLEEAEALADLIRGDGWEVEVSGGGLK